MFLAGKVEETPRPLKDVILVSYEIIHKKDPAAIQRIKQKVFPIGLVVVLCTYLLIPFSNFRSSIEFFALIICFIMLISERFCLYGQLPVVQFGVNMVPLVP